MGIDHPGKSRAGIVAAVGVCAGLLILFAFISWSAVSTKNATFDEPLHLLGGFVNRTSGDFRLNPEDPALFGYLAALPLDRSAIHVNYQSPHWSSILEDPNRRWWFVMTTLYQDLLNNADAVTQKSRFIFLGIGMLLGAMIAWWSWQLAGAWAAVFATALFAFDPNFLGHGPLVKNDVLLTLLMLTMLIACWRFGRRGTLLALAAMACTCAAAVNVKFSGLLFGPIIFIMLLIRALLPAPWTVIGRTLNTRWQRLVVVPAACLIVGIVSYAAIWACYEFRFAPSNDPGVMLNTPQQVFEVKKHLVMYRYQLGADIPWSEIYQ